MAPSEAVEAKIRERATELRQFSEHVENCWVWVHGPDHHHRRGRLFDVRIRLGVPGSDLVVGLQQKEEDVYVSIRNAFDAARRCLEDHERRRRGQTKAHRGAQ
jgi:ribosome-associated translation inhibitor RaiA